MKKIYIVLGILLCLFWSVDVSASANCSFNGDVSGDLKKCVSSTNLYQGDADISANFRGTILSWTQNIALYLGIAAVFAIVYASAMLTLSAGDDEKINKAKNILKWSVFGLLGIMFAAMIITLVINLIYRLGS